MILLWFYLITLVLLAANLSYVLLPAYTLPKAVLAGSLLAILWPLYWIVCVRDYVLHKVLPRGE